MNVSKASVITPAQFAWQWVIAPIAFDVGVYNFKVVMAKETVSIFQQSFYLQHFNTSGATMWHTNYIYDHPILVETGNLMNSITSKIEDKTVNVFTDPNGFRTSKREYGRNFCYAAVHNEGLWNDPQNQFMGDSSVVKDAIAKNTYYIFRFMP